MSRPPKVDAVAFSRECTRRAPFNSLYAAVYDNILHKIVASCGSEDVIRNLYSSTKSICGLVIAHDVMASGYDIHKDISDIVQFLAPNVVWTPGPGGLTLAHFMHHTSGINDVDFKDPAVVADLIFRKKNTHSMIEDYVASVAVGAPFNYSPCLGYMLVGAIYELDKRKDDRTFSIAQRCSELFFTKNMNSWHWPTCEGQDICRHTFAFSEFHASGHDMIELGRNLLVNHRPLLEHILNTANPSYVRHARSGRAGGSDTTSGYEVFVDYDYSYGWWILPGTGVLTTIGLGGQYILIDTLQDLVGVRQQGNIFSKERADGGVRLELFQKKKSFVINSHETFPLLVTGIYFGVDPELEGSRMMHADAIDRLLAK